MERIQLPEGYEPCESEEYMNPMQLEYFLQQLESWKKRVHQESQASLNDIQSAKYYTPDYGQDESASVSIAFAFKRSNRSRKLLDKINAAIERIKNGTYGYCTKTNRKIGIARLKVRMIASMIVDAQENREYDQKHHSSDQYL